MSQTSYGNSPAPARAGQLADGFECDIASKVAAGSVVVGQACVITAAATGLSMGTVGAMTAAQVAADPDAIIASGAASTAGIQDLITTSLNGVVGQTEMIPARKLSATFNSHADWDATTMTIFGLDVDGLACQATITIPNGGNAVVDQNEDVYFSRVTRINIPAQTGTNGTLLVGTVADTAQYQEGQLVIPLYDASREPYNSSNQYVDEESVPCFAKGRMWAPVAAGTALQQLYVRVVTGGGGFGELRGGPAAGFVPFKNGRIVEMYGSTLAKIEVL